MALELVRDEKLTPANSEAETIREAMLKQEILVRVGGVYGNIVQVPAAARHNYETNRQGCGGLPQP